MANGNPNFGQPDDPLLANLLSQLETPKAPERPRVGVGQAIAGGLGDALMNISRVYAGGQPQQGAFAQRAEQQQDEFARQMEQYRQQQANLNNEIAKLKFNLATQERDRLLQAEAEEARRKFEMRKLWQGKAADRFNQADNDSRDAAIKTRQDIMKFYTDAAVKFPGIDLSGIDPATATPQDIAGAIVRHSEGTLGVDLDPNARIAAQEEIIKKMGMKTVAVQFQGSEGVGIPNLRGEKPPDIDLPDPNLINNARSLGVPTLTPDGKPRPRKEVEADYNKEKRKILDTIQQQREQRLRASTERINSKGEVIKGTVGDKLREILDMRFLLDDIERLTTENPGLGGPGGQYIPSVAMLTYLPRDYVNAREDLKTKLQSFFNILGKIRSGAAITAPEELRLGRELPDFNQTDFTRMSRIRTAKDSLNTTLSTMAALHGLGPEDIEALGSRIRQNLESLSFIPTKDMPGDIPIGGN